MPNRVDINCPIQTDVFSPPISGYKTFKENCDGNAYLRIVSSGCGFNYEVGDKVPGRKEQPGVEFIPWKEAIESIDLKNDNIQFAVWQAIKDSNTDASTEIATIQTITKLDHIEPDSDFNVPTIKFTYVLNDGTKKTVRLDRENPTVWALVSQYVIDKKLEEILRSTKTYNQKTEQARIKQLKTMAECLGINTTDLSTKDLTKQIRESIISSSQNGSFSGSKFNVTPRWICTENTSNIISSGVMNDDTKLTPFSRPNKNKLNEWITDEATKQGGGLF